LIGPRVLLLLLLFCLRWYFIPRVLKLASVELYVRNGYDGDSELSYYYYYYYYYLSVVCCVCSVNSVTSCSTSCGTSVNDVRVMPSSCVDGCSPYVTASSPRSSSTTVDADCNTKTSACCRHHHRHHHHHHHHHNHHHYGNHVNQYQQPAVSYRSVFHCILLGY